MPIILELQHLSLVESRNIFFGSIEPVGDKHLENQTFNKARIDLTIAFTQRSHYRRVQGCDVYQCHGAAVLDEIQGL